MPDGTIIVGKLKDDELRESIDSLVEYVDKSATKMKQSFDTNLKGIEDLFKNFGNLSNIATQASTQGTDKRVANANKEVQANNAVVQSYDALATALNKSGGKMSILEQYDMQIAILKEDLIALRGRLAEYNNALNSGDFNKQTWGREQIELANKEAERLMSTIATLESQRGNLANLLNPQGDAFKNFVDDLTKANPELAMLNQQFKEGKALLQDQKTQISQTTQELKIYKADAESLARTEQIKAEAQRKIYEESINAGRKAQEQLRQYQHAMEQVVQSSKGGVITFADAETAMMHYTKLRQILNALTTAYYQMNDAQRQSAEGVALKQDIDMLQRAVPKIYALAESMRPLKDQIAGVESEITKLNVLFKMMSQSEKESARGQELQDKIQRLQNYLKSLEEQTEKTNQATQKTAQTHKQVEQSTESLIKANTRLERTFNYIQTRLMYMLSVFGSMNFVKQLIGVRAEFETMERSLGVLVDSAERGTHIFKELNEMALNSPFTTMELGQAARQLLAYGVAESDLVDTTRRLADVSAAVGTPIERIAYALGQVQTYGYLTSLQAKSFARAGIPLVKELAEVYSDLQGRVVTTGEVYDMMKHKAISYNDVMKVIYRDTDAGGRFFDYQAKMADTLKVQLANLSLAYQNMLNNIAKSNSGLITAPIKGLRALMTSWQEISKAIYAVAGAYGVLKVAQMLQRTVARGNYILETQQVVNGKKIQYQTMERSMALGQLTSAQRQQVLAMRETLVQQYKLQIENDKLTASEIRKRLAIDKGNVALAMAAKQLGLITAQEYKVITSTNAMNGAFTRGFAKIAGNLKAIGWMVAISAVLEFVMAVKSADDAQEEFARNVAEKTKSSSESIKSFLDQYQSVIASYYKVSTQKVDGLPAATVASTTPQRSDLSNKELQDAWSAITEEIKKSSSASSTFIAQLMEIDDINDRVKKGFDYLDIIKQTHDALALIKDDAIDINYEWSAWWNLWAAPDGLVENLKDYEKELQEIAENTFSPQINSVDLKSNVDVVDKALRGAREDFATFEEDLNDFVVSLRSENKRLKIVNPEAERESLEQILSTIETTEETANVLRFHAERAYTQRAMDEFDKRIAYFERTGQKARAEETKNEQIEWKKRFGYGQTSWDIFFQWLSSSHSQVFAQMSETEIRNLDENSDKYKEVIGYLENEFKYSQVAAHKLAYDDLKDRVNDISSWSIRIPVFFDIKNASTLSNLISTAAGGVNVNLGDVTDTAEAAEKLNQQYDDLNKKLKETRHQLEAQKVDVDHIAVAWAPAGSLLEFQINQYKDLEQQIKNVEAQRKAIHASKSKQELKDDKDALKAAKAAETAREKARKAAEKAAREAAEQQRKEEEAVKKALSDEVHVIENVRKAWEELRKAGKTSEDSAQSVYEIYNDMVKDINSVLGKYGIDELSVFDIIDPETKDLKSLQSIYYYLNNQLTQLEKSGKVTRDAIKTISDELKKLYKDIAIDAMEQIEYNFDQSMNKLNEGYEMSVTLEDSPELSDLFADMLGVDMGEVLKDAPRTLREYTRQVNEITAAAINAWAHENGMKEVFTLPKNFSILDKKFWDDFTAKMGKEGIQSPFYKAVEKVRDDLLKSIQKDYTDTTKQWESLVVKYGEIQARIVKLTRDSLSEQVSIIKKFAPEKEIQALDLLRDIRMSNDPEQVEQLKQQFTDLLWEAVGDNEEGRKVVEASIHKLNENIAKAIWDDFKGQDLYTVLFDDLGRASTMSLKLLKDQMDELKFKIKESPESMKALMSAYQKLREELIKRDPFKAMIVSMNDYREAQKELIFAQDQYDVANASYKETEEELNKLLKEEVKDDKEIAKKKKELADKSKVLANALSNLLKKQNISQEAQTDFNKSVDEANSHISKLANAIKGVGSAVGDTAGEVINVIGDIMNFAVTCSEAIKFTSETTSTAIKAIERASVILTIISAAIQLAQKVSSLLPTSDSQYEKAAKKKAEINMLADAVRDYRLAVLQAKAEEDNWFGTNSLKQLKNYYNVGSEAMKSYYEKMNEEQAIYQNKSGGGWLTTFAHWTNPATWIQKATGGKMNNTWAQALGLVASSAFGVAGVVMQTGLQLTDSAGKFQEYAEGYTAAINNLRIETRKARKGFLGSGIGGKSQKTEDLITWVRDKLGLDLFDPETGLLNLEAYEQLMDKYENKLVGQTKETLESLAKYAEEWNNYIDKLHEYVDQMYSPLVDNMVDAMWEWYDNGTNALDNFREYASDTFRNIVGDMMKTIILSNFAEEYAEDIKKMYEKYSAGEMNEEALLRGVASRTGQMMDAYESNIPILENLMMTATDVLRQHGIDLAQGNTELSALQQGIQGITETTANALEAYMNGVSQQVYYQSDLLTQIRDAIILYDFSLQSSINAEILLSLQQSYQVQMAIQTVLTGWSSPDGLSVRVEMI